MNRKLYCGLWGVALMSLGVIAGCAESPTAPENIDSFVVQDAGAGVKAPVIDTLMAPMDMVLPIKHD